MHSLVTIMDGQAVTTTLAIAEGTENEHASVILLVRKYKEDLAEFGGVRFEIAPFATAGGDQMREFANLNEQQATLLLTYMRNSEIVRGFKKRLVKAFFEMARSAREAAHIDPMKVLNDPVALRGLLSTYSEKVLALEGRVAEQAPVVDAFKRIASTEGTLCFRDAAKVLQVRPVDLKGVLLSRGWIYPRPGRPGYLAYQDKIQTGYMVHKGTTVHREDGSEKFVEQPRITTKGLQKLAMILGTTIRMELAEGNEHAK